MSDTTATRPPNTGPNLDSSAPGYTSKVTPPRQLYPAPPFVLMAQNGEHSILQAAPPPPGPSRGGRGWVRGVIAGKTRQSRDRFLRYVASLDQKMHPADAAAVVTHTYGSTFPLDPQGWARDTKELKRLMEARFGHVGTILQKEFGGRECPHYHLVAVMPPGVSPRKYVREARKVWRRIAGDGSSTNLRRGTDGRVLDSWRKVRGYLSKSEALATQPETGRPKPTGRMWSVWRPEKLTIRYRKVSLTGAVYLKLRRILRRVARPVGGPSRLRADRFDRQHVMISEAEMMKLLEHLGVDTS